MGWYPIPHLITSSTQVNRSITRALLPADQTTKSNLHMRESSERCTQAHLRICSSFLNCKSPTAWQPTRAEHMTSRSRSILLTKAALGLSLDSIKMKDQLNNADHQVRACSVEAEQSSLHAHCFKSLPALIPGSWSIRKIIQERMSFQFYRGKLQLFVCPLCS